MDAAAAVTPTKNPWQPEKVEVEIVMPSKLPKNTKLITSCLPYLVRPDRMAFCKNGDLTKSDGCCGKDGLCVIPYPFCGDCPKGCIG